MEIKSEIDSIIENINNSNVDGDINDKEVCKVEEGEVEELKFESSSDSEDKNEGDVNSDENVATPEGGECSNEGTFGAEDFKDEIKVEEIDTSDWKYKATRKRSIALVLEESKQKIDLNDNRYYGRRLGRSTRAFKRINYNERTESDGEESIPVEMQSQKRVREDNFFIDNEENKENRGQWTQV